MAKRKGKTTVMNVIENRFKRDTELNNVDVIQSVWFTTMKGKTIGIVTKENPFGEVRSYIGVAKGFDKAEDIKDILLYGAPFKKEMLP